MRSVAETILGPDLIPPALRLARWAAVLADHPDVFQLAERGQNSSLSEHSLPLDYVITWEEAKLLQHYGTYAELYEAQFSRRFKDCHTDNSVLTAAESTRFRAAFFRIWLFLLLPEDYADIDDGNPSDGFLTDDEEPEDEEDDPEEQPVPNAPDEELAPQVQLAPIAPRVDCDRALENLDQTALLDIFLVQNFLDAFVLEVNKRNEWKDAAGT